MNKYQLSQYYQLRRKILRYYLGKTEINQQMRKIASMSSCLISMFGILKTQTSQKGVAMDTLIDYILILIGCF
jgi:hypothetical protein